jgi:hypothetical protein
MKVRFYSDVPVWHNGINLYANQQQPPYKPMEGYRRVAFDVSFPEDLLKRADIGAVVQFVGEVADPNSAPEDESGDA